MKHLKFILAIFAFLLFHSIATAQGFLTNGLAAYYPFNGNANDASGNGDNGTLVGSAQYGPGINGLGVVLNGNQSGVQLGNPTNLWLQTFSIESWIRRTSPSVVSYGSGGVGTILGDSPGGYYFAIDSGGRLGFAQLGNNNALTGPAITDTNWHQVALTLVGGSVVFYVDGVAESSQTYNVTFTFTGNVAIGYRPDNADNSFYGTLDEVRIYSRALSAAEVMQLYTYTNNVVDPQITSQPVNVSVNYGDTASFSVEANGLAPLNFQWQKDGVNLANATNATLTLTNVQPTLIGNYAVVVSDINGSVTSTSASLSVSNVDSGAWQGLMAYYPFNGNANDASLNGDNGVLVGNAKYGPGITGQGLLLDGSGSGVALGNPANLRLQNFSIESWIRRTSASVVSYGSGGVATIVGDSPGGYYFLMDSGGRLGFAQLGNGSSLVGPTITDTNWHQVVFTMVGGSAVFYVDGVAESSQTYNVTFTFTGSVAIGYRPDNADNSFNGTLDDVRIYNRALSSTNVMELYAFDTAQFIHLTQDITNTSVLYGQTAFFSVAATGSVPISYQWYSSAPSASGLAGAYAALAGSFVYSAVVTNGGYGYGTAPNVGFVGGGGTGAAGFATISNGTVIGIMVTNAGYGYSTAPSIVIDPPDGFIYGATNSILIISDVNPGDVGDYYVVLTNSTGTVNSSMASLSILYPPSISSQPQDDVVVAYGTALFSVTANGTLPLSYHWLFNGSSLPNAALGTLIITNVTPPNLGPYSVVITNNYGSVTSLVANLYMYPYLEMPFSGGVTYWGQTNILSVGAWGSSLSYQWYFNGAAIPGSTSSNLLLSGIQFTNAGLYSVVVSSPYGSVTNTPELVVVNPANVSLKLCPDVVIQGTVGYTYIIESTTDLSNTNSWVVQTNLTLTQPIEYWDDTSVDVHTGPQKFYQVLPGQ